ncbi:MAG: glycosyltransferase [Rubrivivax sp.]|nr:glycosyltransferase [Rubrivivax sp.]
MKNSAEVLAAIHALEEAFPVDTWHCGDLPLWPWYRVRLYVDAVNDMLAASPSLKPLARLRHLAGRAARAVGRVPLASWRDRRSNAPVRSGATAVLLSDGMSFTRLGEAWYDRVMDPVLQGLAAQGHAGLKLTPLAEAHVPRMVPSRFVQPRIDLIKLLATRRPVRLHAPGLDALRLAAAERFRVAAPDEAWLRLQAARLQALASWFDKPLRATGASLAFVNTYYSLEGQAFVLAARRLGLRTIDLQHGMQGPQHVAYAGWSRVPAGGYATLPDEFWVWSEEDADVIRAWGARAEVPHRPRVTGNYWLDRWRDESEPLVARFLAEAAAQRGGAERQVLVSLIWGVSEDEEINRLIEAARRCPPSFGWWWRLHPVEAHRRAELAARLQRHGLDGSRVGAATDLPLYALVRRADIVVSHSSTVLAEAAQLGVPCVVTSDYGAGLHERLVRDGLATHANDAAGIARAIVAAAARTRPAARAGGSAAGSLAQALRDVTCQAHGLVPAEAPA